jgi:hypothetical protein
MISKAKKFGRNPGKLIADNPAMAIGLGVAAVTMGIARFRKAATPVKAATKAAKS